VKAVLAVAPQPTFQLLETARPTKVMTEAQEIAEQTCQLLKPRAVVVVLVKQVIQTEQVKAETA
jgi:hypothetical protein